MAPLSVTLLALLAVVASSNDSPRTALTSAGPAALSKPPPTREHIAACDSPCHSCIAAARSGDVTTAAKHARACTDAGEKAICVSAAKAAAPSAAIAAGFNGNCSRARAIVAAANSMGAGTRKLSQAFAKTRCR
jgi:hypothetical protein